MPWIHFEILRKMVSRERVQIVQDLEMDQCIRFQVMGIGREQFHVVEMGQLLNLVGYQKDAFFYGKVKGWTRLVHHHRKLRSPRGLSVEDHMWRKVPGGHRRREE